MHPLQWSDESPIIAHMEPTNGTSQKVRRHAHLTADLIKQLEAIAEENDRSFASQLRTALKEWISWQRTEALEARVDAKGAEVARMSEELAR
jgi:hypothetical protein